MPVNDPMEFNRIGNRIADIPRWSIEIPALFEVPSVDGVIVRMRSPLYCDEMNGSGAAVKNLSQTARSTVSLDENSLYPRTNVGAASAE